jgi:MFS family permease
MVFVAGGASLATEMTGARLLARYFGASDLVWANVIGLVLVAVAVGYWIGGRLADRFVTHRALALVVLVAAALAIIPFATRPLFAAAVSAFANVSEGAFIASFFGALAMFIVPVTALGAVAPWSIRLAVDDIRHAGAVAGRLYAPSTMGAILGTFLPVLVLIPTIGTRHTLLGIAAVLALVATPARPTGRWTLWWARADAPTPRAVSTWPAGWPTARPEKRSSDASRARSLVRSTPPSNSA